MAEDCGSEAARSEEEMIKVTKDKRTIRTGKDYTRFRQVVYELQGAMCGQCRIFTSMGYEPEHDYSFHVHHKNGRGMGGSKRDDTFEACTGLCGSCHRKEHGQ